MGGVTLCFKRTSTNALCAEFQEWRPPPPPPQQQQQQESRQ